jgi:hypothetical protein
MRALLLLTLSTLVSVVLPAVHLGTTPDAARPAAASPARRVLREIRDEHGILRLRVPLLDEAFHGEYRTWYADGRPFERRHYVHGREEGRQQSWTPDGSLFLNYEVRDGRRYGFVNARPCRPVAAAR